MKQARTVVVAGALALAALAGGSGGQAQPLSQPAAPQPAPSPQPNVTPPATPAGGACEAASLAWLVGKPRSAIPVPVYPSLRRVYCSTCMVTQDYLPERTDIVFDSDTGTITAVKCG